MMVRQAYRFEMDPSNVVRSALGSHAGAARFAFNWGLAEVESRLEARRVLITLALRQGASVSAAESWAAGLVGPIPWSLPALRREWNRAKDEVAPWWRENSKEAYSSGLDALARGLKNYNLASLVKAVGTASGAGTGRNLLPANAQGEERFMPNGRCSSTNCEDGTGPTRPDKTATAVAQSTAA